MRVIWKFPLELKTHNKLLMPEGALVVHVAAQSGVPCLWALCEPRAPKEPRLFAIVPTGMAFDENDATYLGTFILNGGGLHVLEPPRKRSAK